MDEPRRIAHYEIVRLLGRGGMGEVYLATDTRLYRRPVAIKLLAESMYGDSRALTRFDQEIETAAKLQHPNIVTIYDHGTHEGRPFFAMEYLEGEDLASLIKKPGSRTVEGRLEIIVQLCDALDYAHRSGIVHRDIKPANVVIIRRGRDDHVKLLDFGIAKVARPDHTKTLVQPGTMFYMSPEQLKDDPVDARSDLFSLGIVAYELLGGAHPFAARTEYLVTSNIMFAQHAPLRSLDPTLPAELERILDRLLDKERERRPSSAGEIATEIRRCLASFRASPGGTDPPTFGNIDEMTSAMIERLVHWARTREAAGAPLEALEAYRRASSLAPAARWLQERVAKLEAAVAARPVAASGSRAPEREGWVTARLAEAESSFDEGALDAASSILAAILRQFPDERRALDLMDRLVVISDRRIPVREYRHEMRRAREALVVGDVLAARQSCEAAIALWPDDVEASTLGKEIEKRRRVELASTLHALEEALGRAEAGMIEDERLEGELAAGREALERAVVLGAEPPEIDHSRARIDRLSSDARARLEARRLAEVEERRARLAEIERALAEAQEVLEGVERAPARGLADVRDAIRRLPEVRASIARASRVSPSDSRVGPLAARADTLELRLGARAAEIEARESALAAREAAITARLAEVHPLFKSSEADLDRAAELLRWIEREISAWTSEGAAPERAAALAGRAQSHAGTLARRREEIEVQRRGEEEVRRRGERAARLLEEARSSIERGERERAEDLATLRASVESVERAAEAITQALHLDPGIVGAGELSSRATAIAKRLAERIAGEEARIAEEKKQAQVKAEADARGERVRQVVATARSSWEEARSEEPHLDVAADHVLPILARTVAALDEALRLAPDHAEAQRLRKDALALQERAKVLAPRSPARRDTAELRGEVEKLKKLEASGREGEALSLALKLEPRITANAETEDLEETLKPIVERLRQRRDEARRRLVRRALWGTAGFVAVVGIVGVGLWLRPSSRREETVVVPSQPPPVDVEPRPQPTPDLPSPPPVKQAPRAEIEVLEIALRRSQARPGAPISEVRRSVDAAEAGLKRAGQLALSFPGDTTIPPLRDALRTALDNATDRRSGIEKEVANRIRTLRDLIGTIKISSGPAAGEKYREAADVWEKGQALDPDNVELLSLKRELDRLHKPAPTDRPTPPPSPPPTAAPSPVPSLPPTQQHAFERALEGALGIGRMDFALLESRIAALRGAQRILDDGRRKNEAWAWVPARGVELQNAIDEAEIRLVLFRYARAASALDLPGIQSVWPSYSGGDSLRELKSNSVQFDSMEVSLTAKRAVAKERTEYKGLVGAVNRSTVLAEYTLELRNDRWIIVGRTVRK